jgi:hypothetical protein
MGNLTTGVAGSLIAWLISVVVTAALAKTWGQKRALSRVYDALDPVLRQLGDLRQTGRLDANDAQSLVRTLSTQLGTHFAGGSDNLPEYRRNEWTGPIRPECGICGKAPDVSKDLQSCAVCKLNCCAWNQ